MSGSKPTPDLCQNRVWDQQLLRKRGINEPATLKSRDCDFGTGLVILIQGHMTRTTPEPAPSFTNFHVHFWPERGRLILDVRLQANAGSMSKSGNGNFRKRGERKNLQLWEKL
ncbi:hypothetical protein AVEN_26731-1, partial [Araneus ventricosus]